MYILYNIHVFTIRTLKNNEMNIKSTLQIKEPTGKLLDSIIKRESGSRLI